MSEIEEMEDYEIEEIPFYDVNVMEIDDGTWFLMHGRYNVDDR